MAGEQPALPMLGARQLRDARAARSTAKTTSPPSVNEVKPLEGRAVSHGR